MLAIYGHLAYIFVASKMSVSFVVVSVTFPADGRPSGPVATGTVRRWLGRALRQEWAGVGVSTALYSCHTPCGAVGTA
jgi:hypothetical protein